MSHRDVVFLAVALTFCYGMVFAGALYELEAGATQWARAWATFCAVLAPAMAVLAAWGLKTDLDDSARAPAQPPDPASRV